MNFSFSSDAPVGAKNEGVRALIPRALSEWTKDSLTELLDKKLFEPESFDFKTYRPGTKSEQEKRDIRKDCCAFANSTGGFLVYGVADDKRLPTKDRLVGIERKTDFPAEFGDFPRECRPSVNWEFLNPPIDLGNGKVIHVVFIPRSWRGPHCIASEQPQGGFVFAKRTNKGNEDMAYEEVRMAFLGYYEKRLKLQLLNGELQSIIGDARSMILPDEQMETHYSTVTFSLTVLESVLIDTYTILHELPDLIQALTVVRNTARNINNNQQMFYSIAHFPLTGKERLMRSHNESLRSRCPLVIQHAETALTLLQAVLAT